METGLHLAVLTEKVPVAVNRHSHVQHAFSGSRIKVVFGTVNRLPAGSKGTIVVHVIVASIQIQPADDQSAVGLSVVIFVSCGIVDQAGLHDPVGTEVV